MNRDARVRFVERDAVALKLEAGKMLVLFTENLSGHRIQWLTILKSRLDIKGKTLVILSLRIPSDSLRNLSPNMDLELCSDFDSKGELIRFIRPYSDLNDFITWDGDNWILELLKHNLKCRMLIMRPYLDFSSLLSFFKTGIKIALCHWSSYFRKFEIAFLGIALYEFCSFQIPVVDDELDIPEAQSTLSSSNDSGNEKDAFKVILPGFITGRKNPFLAIMAIEEARKFTEAPINLYFLGSISTEFDMTSITPNRDWIHLTNKYFDRESFLKELASADLVLLPYSNKASSSLALESMAVGTRVLMGKDNCWENLMKANSDLLFMSPLQVQRFANAILEILTSQVRHTMNVELNYRSRQSALDFLIFGRK